MQCNQPAQTQFCTGVPTMTTVAVPPARQRGVGGNYLLNVAGNIVPLLISLVVTPIYIRHLGADRYGILAIVWLMLGYFGFLDFGLSRATANALSRLGHAGPEERVPVLVTSLYLNALFGTFGGIVLFFAGRLILAHMAGHHPEVAGETMRSMAWIACMLPIALISGVGAGAIESRERFAVSNIFTAAAGALGQLLPLTCVLLIGPALTIVIPAALASRAIATVCILIYVVRTEQPVDFRRFDRARVRSLLGYGAWVSVTSLLSPLLETADVMLIGALLGPAAVAHYSVPANMASRSQVIANGLGKTLFPRLSRLDRQEADKLSIRATVTLAYGFAAICAPATILAGPFFVLWLGPAFAAYAAPVAAIVIIGAWTNGVALMPYTLLQSQGRPDLTAKIHAGEVVPFLGTVWLLTVWLGLPGAALAWTLRTMADLLLLLRVGGLMQAPLIAALPACAVMLLSYGVAALLHPAGFAALAFACAASAAVLGCALVWDRPIVDLARTLWAKLEGSTSFLKKRSKKLLES